MELKTGYYLECFSYNCDSDEKFVERSGNFATIEDAKETLSFFGNFVFDDEDIFIQFTKCKDVRKLNYFLENHYSFGNGFPFPFKLRVVEFKS